VYNYLDAEAKAHSECFFEGGHTKIVLVIAQVKKVSQIYVLGVINLIGGEALTL